MKRDRIFISYSHKDKVWLEELQTHLKPFVRTGGIVTWDDRTIRAGDLWREKIDNALQAASVAVLLVSPNFLASDFIMNVELPMLLKAAASGELKVCWLKISECAVEKTDLPKFQAAHDPLHPLNSLRKSQRDQVLTKVARTASTLYEATKEAHVASAQKASNRSPKTGPVEDSSTVDPVMKYIATLLEESTLFSAEKRLLETAEFFVGRDDELQVISKAFASCIDKKRTETVFIQGDFGTGKTSLISKFLLDVPNNQPKNPLVVYTQCQKEREHEGWLPFITLFKLLIVKTIKNKILSKKQLAQYLLDFCFAWLKLAEPELGSLLANSNFSQDAIQIQFCKFLSKIGYNQVLVIVMDDLQWADKSSLGLLSYLSSETNNSQILILTAFRPEGLNKEELQRARTKLLPAKNVKEVRLPFGIDVEAYIQKRYQNNIFPPELIKQIERFSDGQALYLDQLFSYLEQENLIVRSKEDDRWMLANSMQTLSIPDSIGGVLEERIRDMKEEYREILDMASVEGEEFTVQVVSKLLKWEEDDLIAELPRVGAESRLIAEEGPQDIDVLTFDFYKFTHRFFREHIYSHLESDAQRRRLHYAVAKYLEDLVPNKNSLASTLAFHYLEAHDYKNAMVYAKLAAEHAYEVGKWVEAIEWAKEVLRIFDNDKIQNIQEAVDVLIIWVGAAEYLGKYDDLSKRIDEFIPLVKDKNKSLYAKLLQAYASFCYFENKPFGEKYAKQAIQLFHELNDVESELDTKRVLADILVDYENNLEEGVKVNRDLIEESKQYQTASKVAFNYSSLAWSLLNVGKFQEALNIAQKAYDLVADEKIKDRATLGFVYRVLGRALYTLGQYPEAIQYQQQAIGFYQQMGNVLEEHWVRFELGSSYIERGMNKDGLLEYKICLQYAQRVQDDQFQAWIRAEFATIDMLNGDYEVAEKELLAAEKLLSEDKTQYDRFDYLLRLAQLYILQRDNRAQSLSCLEEAEKLIAKHGFDIELIRLNYLHSQLCAENDEFERAVDYLNQNIELCQRLEVKVELCDCYEHLGDLYKNKGHSQLSENNYQLALNTRQELGHQQKVETILSKLKSLNNIN